jgi:hypothetical protein
MHHRVDHRLHQSREWSLPHRGERRVHRCAGTYSNSLRASRNRDQVTDVRCRSHAGSWLRDVRKNVGCRPAELIRAAPPGPRPGERTSDAPGNGANAPSLFPTSRKCLPDHALERRWTIRGTFAGRFSGTSLDHSREHSGRDSRPIRSDLPIHRWATPARPLTSGFALKPVPTRGLLHVRGDGDSAVKCDVPTRLHSR